jgi:hypothetical protein
MRNIFFFTLILSLVLLSACDDAETFDVREDSLIDYKIEINGEWSLHSIHRNGSDLSGQFNASALTLTISDGSFTLGSSALPFPTLKTSGTPFASGSWTFDDDFKPTNIQFTNGSDIVPASLSMPLFGKNNSSLGLQFSLGCGATTYVYHFKK